MTLQSKYYTWVVMASNTDKRCVYVALLDEGTNVWRPVSAIQLESNQYVLLRPQDYDPESELWQFLPGEIVLCELREKQGERFLVATSNA